MYYKITKKTGTAFGMLFMDIFTTAIILKRNYYYLFDSHSRNEREVSIADGTSVFMKFSDLFEIENCIQVAYLESRARHQAYFKMSDLNMTDSALCRY